MEVEIIQLWSKDFIWKCGTKQTDRWFTTAADALAQFVREHRYNTTFTVKIHYLKQR
jgi:hypothetical protein